MKIKKVSLLMSVGLIVSLLLLTTQAFAARPVSVDAKNTPGTPPGKPTGGPGKTHGKPQHFKGIIKAAGAGSLTLTLDDGTDVNFIIGPDTRIKAPGIKGETDAVLQVGLQAMVQAVADDGGNLVARSIMIIPGKPVLAHRVGWVTEYTPGVSITIQAHDGNLYTFTLLPDAKILPAERAGELAVGSRVTIIAPRDPASLGWTAFGIVVHPAGSGEGSLPPTSTAVPEATATPTP
jgi:hypothetical protein